MNNDFNTWKAVVGLINSNPDDESLAELVRHTKSYIDHHLTLLTLDVAGGVEKAFSQVTLRKSKDPLFSIPRINFSGHPLETILDSGKTVFVDMNERSDPNTTLKKKLEQVDYQNLFETLVEDVYLTVLHNASDQIKPLSSDLHELKDLLNTFEPLQLYAYYRVLVVTPALWGMLSLEQLAITPTPASQVTRIVVLPHLPNDQDAVVVVNPTLTLPSAFGPDFKTHIVLSNAVDESDKDVVELILQVHLSQKFTAKHSGSYGFKLVA